MRGRQFAVVLALVAVGIAGVAVPAVGLDLATQADEAGKAELGTQMTSFAQATAADASNSVDAGMWNARINQSDDPATAIRERTAALEQRLAALESRTEALAAANSSAIAYTGRATAVRAELANVRSQINETTSVAQRRGVNVSKLDGLRSRAGEVRGPAISEIARQMTEPSRGPPAETPGNNGPPDGERGPPEDGQGPPDDDAGPPEETPGTDDSNQSGNENSSNGRSDTGNGGGNGGGPPGESSQ